MPKTIAITPSWYWPAGVPRVVGVPPFSLPELLADRRARHDPDGLAVVDSGERLTNAELAAQVAEAAGRATDTVAMSSETPTVRGVVAFLGALAGGKQVLFDESGSAGTGSEEITGLRSAAVGLSTAGTTAWHSQRGLLAGALSLGAFLQVGAERPWLSTFGLGSWEGLYGIAVPLAFGAPLVLSAAGEGGLEHIVREGVGIGFTDLASAYHTSREAKRDVKAVRGVLGSLLLSTGGMFDADQRRRVSKMFECPALTTFGMPETGPIFTAHQSWYIDEAIGIPMTNAHVVPVDPRSYTPVQTLWELVESAMVTVYSPMLAVGYEGGADADRFRDNRFITGVIASSDANGMIYLLPDAP